MISMTEKQAQNVLTALKTAKKPTKWLENKLGKSMVTGKTVTKKTSKKAK